MAVDAGGNFYIADEGHEVIREVSARDRLIEHRGRHGNYKDITETAVRR